MNGIAVPPRSRLARLLLAAALALPASASLPAFAAADPALARTLQDHAWTLQSATEGGGQPVDGLVVPDKPFVLRFERTRFSAKGGCNTLFGGWRLDAQGRLAFGRPGATMMSCDAPLMKADQALSALLAQPLAVEVDGGPAPTLRLTTAAQQRLVLRGEPTLASRYGAPTRIFLEVAPQTVACQPGAGAPAQCLQVRDRRFDKQGLRIDPPGPWRTFFGEIQGYAHASGTRNVLRIDRYTRPQPPADASRYVYVLDLVVESEVVKP